MYKNYLLKVFVFGGLGFFQCAGASQNRDERFEAVRRQLDAHGDANEYLKAAGYAPEPNFSKAIQGLEDVKDDELNRIAQQLLDDGLPINDLDTHLTFYGTFLDQMFDTGELKQINRDGNSAKHEW